MKYESFIRVLIGSLLALALLLAICSCQSDENQNVFTAEVEPTSLPNRYRAHLRWQTAMNQSSWVIQREDKNEGLKNLVILEVGRQEYVDLSVVAGETYHYILARIENSRYVPLSEATATIDTDLEVNGLRVLGDIRVHRLFLGPDSRIVTNGQEVHILADEIYSDGGTIESFPAGQTAPNEQPGRSGGSIEIGAKLGYGKLYLVARGENGGQGKAGNVGERGLRGADGVNGQCGFRGDDSRCEAFPPNALKELHECESLPGKMQKSCKENLMNLYCKTQTGDGYPGGRGSMGTQGGTGAAGGESASVLVRVANPAQFQVIPVVISGKGGLGGPGGEGGPGGPGGRPGAQDRLGLCRVANPGPKGEKGLAGSIGNPGPDGQIKSICLLMGTARFGTCDIQEQVHDFK